VKIATPSTPPYSVRAALPVVSSLSYCRPPALAALSNPADPSARRTRERELTFEQTCPCARDLKETLMRMPALAILTTATVLTAASGRAQTYDPAYPVCLHVYGRGATITNAATRRCLNATGRHGAAPPSASSIHILRARKHPWDHVTGGIVRSTRCLASSGFSNVCCWKKGGKHLLAASVSPFGWKRTSISGRDAACSRAAAAGLVRLF
jgi:hypothetical protein